MKTVSSLPTALQELSAFKQWLVHRADKIPLRASDFALASATNPADWSTFAEAQSACERSQGLGLGFVLTEAAGLSCIDLDASEDPSVIASQTEIYEAFDSYTERSPSGKGAHIWVKGKVASGKRLASKKLEVYSRARYMTVTFDVFNDAPIQERQSLLDDLVSSIDAASARNTNSGQVKNEPRTWSNETIAAGIAKSHPHLWNCNQAEESDRSKVDFQLCKEIARYSRNRQQTYEVFMQSPRANTPRNKTGQDRMKCVNRPKYVHDTVIDAFKDIDWLAENLQRDGVKIGGTSSESTQQSSSKTAGKIEFRTLSFIAPEAIQWLWDKWLPLGKMVLLAGAPGTGKSTLAFSMAATASRGGKWADGTQCAKPVHILLWSSEDDAADTIRPRLQAMGANLDYIHLVDATTLNGEKRPFNPATDMDYLKSAMKSNDVSLLIIDPIVSAVTGDMNKSNEVRRGLQAIVDFASEINCCVLGITHFAKGTTGRNPAERVIGSVAFGAFARMVLVAARDEETEGRVFVRAKSNISTDTGGIRYAIEEATLDQSKIKATHIVWGEQIDGSSREILAEVEHQDNGKDNGNDKLVEAKEYLLEALKAGPQAAKRIIDDAIQLGIASEKTIYRAKKMLKVRSKKQGLEWLWMEPLPLKPIG
jgi:putative DNA primase/helicase